MKRGNKGSSIIEACIVIPLFLFFMLFVIYLYRMIYVDAHIHQSLCEASVYCAERLYLEDRLLSTDKIDTDNEENKTAVGIIYMLFQKYMADDPLVDQIVAGGQKGIVISVTTDKEDKKVFIAKATYMTKFNIPVLGSFLFPRSNEVKQKAFLGCSEDDTVDEDDMYVYITPNESVYHMRRSCSHLTRSVRETTAHGGYEPCGFCGKTDNATKVYVTENGGVYHCNPNCLGLKRTVTRVRKREVSGLSVCSRCGR